MNRARDQSGHSEVDGLTTRGMWIPLIAVIVVLSTLVAVPIVLSARLRRQRAVITDIVDPARVKATDLASFLAEEMFAVGMRAPSASPIRDPRYTAAVAAEHRDAFALDSLLESSSAGAVERFAQYREAATRWHDDVESMTRSPVPTELLDSARVDGSAALASARHLVELLEQIGVSVRTGVRRTERIDVLLPAALCPLALLACVLIVRAGQRTVRLAAISYRDRRALADVMEQKSAFMRGISHDLQNPLGAALGHIDLMLEGIMTPEAQHDALVRVRRLTKRASDTVAALLTLARSETGAIELEPTEIDLAALVRAAVDDHSLVAGAKSQAVEYRGPPACPAFGDAPRVRHIIDNLLSNASKYTPRNGRISVRVARRTHGPREWASLTVEDSGPGIPSAWHERVFEEFARAPGTRDIAPGHGIGLAMSRRVARMMGGDLTVDTPMDGAGPEERLGGAAVTLWLTTFDGESRN